MLPTTFAQYLHRSSNLCLYGVRAVPPPLRFPHATTVTLIHCSPHTIPSLLSPSVFPHLQHIHYLSGDPGVPDLYRRFPTVQWRFPNQHHLFYQCMVEAGYGIVEPRLFRTYVHRFLPSFQEPYIELRLPGYGLYLGEWYQSQWRTYAHATHSLPPLFSSGPCAPYRKTDTDAFFDGIEDTMERDFFDTILEKEEPSKKISKRDGGHYP